MDWLQLWKGILSLGDIYTWNCRALAIPLEINTLLIYLPSLKKKKKSWNYLKSDFLNLLSALKRDPTMHMPKGIWWFFLHRFICCLALTPAVVWAHPFLLSLAGVGSCRGNCHKTCFWVQQTSWVKALLLDLIYHWASIKREQNLGSLAKAVMRLWTQGSTFIF